MRDLEPGDDFEDREYPDPDDGDDDETTPCPHCRRPIFEDSVRCPECGRYLSREDTPPRRRPAWMIVGLLLALFVALRWALWF